MATRDETRRQSSWSPVWVQNVESCASRQYHNWLRLLWCCCCRPGLCWTHFMIRDHNRDELFLRNLNICLLLYTRLLQGQSEGHQLLTMMINVVVGLMFSKVPEPQNEGFLWPLRPLKLGHVFSVICFLLFFRTYKIGNLDFSCIPH